MCILGPRHIIVNFKVELHSYDISTPMILYKKLISQIFLSEADDLENSKDWRPDISWLQQILNALHWPLECQEHTYMLGCRSLTNMSVFMSASIKKSNSCHKIIKWFEKIENTMA